MVGTGLQLGITSTEGLGEFRQAVWLFYIKNIANCLKYFLQCKFISLFRIPTEAKAKCCLVLPGYLQKSKKAIDFVFKKPVANFSGRSKTFARLAADTNI